MKLNFLRIIGCVLVGIIALLFLGEIVCIVMYGWYVRWTPSQGIILMHVRDEGPSPRAVIDPPNSTLFIHQIYPSDPSNDQVIVGAAHNIFVGRVIKQIGNKETEIGPRTQYSVEVIDNVKGQLKDTVTVDMFGGYNKDGNFVVVEGDDQSDFLLQVGTTYIFATRYNAQENWHTLIAHPNARKILSIDSHANINDLKTLAESDEKFKRFEAVFPEEILDKADIANHNTRNAFKDLPPEAKAAAQSRADEAKASLTAEGKGGN